MNVSIIGCGLIGARRARSAIAFGDRVAHVFDTDRTRAEQVARSAQAQVADSAEAAMKGVDIVVVSTPNKFLAPLARQALESGRHVLIEKPMGRDLAEARALLDCQQAHRDLVLKVGFNHRYHPAIAAAYEAVRERWVGELLYMRGIYGHGGRPGYEKEWRGNRDMAGGGELTDQGVHLIDLTCWFAGAPDWTFAQGRTYVWPLGDLEDNGFVLLGWMDGKLAQLHTSWTQWKNKFAFEAFCADGSIEVHGLGGHYGEESLTIVRRNPAGGVPDVKVSRYPGADPSWDEEWKDFRHAIDRHTAPKGSATEGWRVMKVLDAVYRSCETQQKALVAQG